LIGVRDVFLTHGHLDHALGLPWVLSQRKLQRLGATRIVCPAAIAGDVEAFLAAAERLERTEFARELVPLEPGGRVEVGRNLAVEAFAVEHVVPSLGYHLLRRRHRLRAELRGAPAPELAARRLAGERLDEEVEEVWLSYTGDTGRAVFERAPRLAESRVVMIECTFLAPASSGRGAAYGHLHIDDLAANVDRLRGCEAVVLIHLSRRHSRAELARAVERRLPELAARIHLLVPEAA
jgi:ribonuclease Z